MKTMEESKEYIGMLVTSAGNVRHDEVRGNRKSAYLGSYKVPGNNIHYVDDTGFTADGKFINEYPLHHDG